MDFLKEFKETQVQPGDLGIMWLGQAGFLLKNSSGKYMAIDIYLSNLSERLDGNKRLMRSLIAPEELDLDVILATHCHTDHLDIDSLPTILSKGTRLYCCKESYRLCEQAKLPEHQITAMCVGDQITDSGYEVEAVFADHGDSAPDALGFLIRTDGVTVYFTGDTNYQMNRMQYVTDQDIDLLLVPINGEYGNMNERDAAMLAAQTKAKLTIPCHFWTFARHQGSPYQFKQEMKAESPECPVYIMAQGESFIYKKESK